MSINDDLKQFGLETDAEADVKAAHTVPTGIRDRMVDGIPLARLRLNRATLIFDHGLAVSMPDAIRVLGGVIEEVPAWATDDEALLAAVRRNSDQCTSRDTLDIKKEQ